MARMAEIAGALQGLLTGTAEEIGDECQLIRRKREFTASSLLSTVVFGFLRWSNPKWEQLASLAREWGSNVSPQAIEQRFTVALRDSLKGLWQAAVQCVVVSDSREVRGEDSPRRHGVRERRAGVLLFRGRWLGGVSGGLGVPTSEKRAAGPMCVWRSSSGSWRGASISIVTAHITLLFSPCLRASVVKFKRPDQRLDESSRRGPTARRFVVVVRLGRLQSLPTSSVESRRGALDHARDFGHPRLGRWAVGQPV